jgi:pantoate kinase
MTIRAARVEFTADQGGFVVRNRRGTVSEPWVTHLTAAWVDVDRMEFDAGRHDEVVALYARMTSGDWRYVMDSAHLSAREWTGLADIVARSTGGRVTLDLSRRWQGPYRPGP